MPDWEGFVRRHLTLPELKPERESRIVREVASQLEDFYREALSEGLDDDVAVAFAEGQVRNWDELAGEVRRADRAEYRSVLERWADRDSGSERRGIFRRLAGWVRIDPSTARHVVKNPRFMFAALVTLGIGIGANTALFSIVHSVLLSPLPYDDPQELVFVWETRDKGSRNTPASLGNFEAWRASGPDELAMAAARWRAFNVTGGDTPYRVEGLEATSGLVAVLGTHTIVGREFAPQDERPGADAICMVNFDFWQEELEAKEDLTGIGLVLNGTRHRVVGVLPAGFEFPGFGPSPILTPLTLDPSHPGYWSNHNTMVMGRLEQNRSLDQEAERLSAIASRLELEEPDWNEGIGVQLVQARDQLVQRVRQSLWFLFAAVGCILIIGCVNVASLLLARAINSEADLAIRVVLGASRASVARLFMSEALVLSLAGGLLGLLIAYLGVETFQHWGPSNLPRLNEIEVSLPVVLFSLACAVGTGLLAGLIPALRLSYVDLQSSLNKGGRSRGLGAQQRIQRVFVVVEVAVAVILLSCAGLLFKTLGNLIAVDPGFESKDRVAMQLSLPGDRYPDRERVTVFLEDLHDRLDAIPGVRQSGSSVGLPLQWQMWRKQMTVEGIPAQTLPEVPVVDLSISTPGYTRALGIRTIHGRSLSDVDDSSSEFVAVVNQDFVRRFLPGGDVVGHRVRFAPPDALLPPGQRPGDFPWYTIVGVVGDVKRWGLAAEAFPEVFISQRQDMDAAREFFVVAQSDLPPETLAGDMRQAVWEVDPDLPVAWVRSIETMVSTQMAQPRFSAALVGGFALMALILAVVGVYALMANMIGARTSEIGLRIALGASPNQVVKQMSLEGFAITLRGIAIGLAGSFVAVHYMASMLFGVGPLDAATFGVVATTVLLTACVAVFFPVWRAANLDAATALAAE